MKRSPDQHAVYLKTVCTRKKAYRLLSKAQHAILCMGKTAKLAPYDCPVCGMIHIGHIVPFKDRVGHERGRNNVRVN